MHRSRNRELGIRGNRETDPQAADPYDGGCMKHSLNSALFGIGILVLIFDGTMSLSRSTSAAEKVGAEATASAAPAASDGALFLQFVSVLRHPRCKEMTGISTLWTCDVGRKVTALPLKSAAPAIRTIISPARTCRLVRRIG